MEVVNGIKPSYSYIRGQDNCLQYVKGVKKRATRWVGRGATNTTEQVGDTCTVRELQVLERKVCGRHRCSGQVHIMGEREEWEIWIIACGHELGCLGKLLRVKGE